MTVTFWIGLLIGLIIGWVAEWFIDRYYWRKRFEGIEYQLQDTKDRLRDIKGIGKVLEKRLNDAGIYSFSALAALTPEELAHIAGNADYSADESELIRQAGKFAKKKKKKK